MRAVGVLQKLLQDSIPSPTPRANKHGAKCDANATVDAQQTGARPADWAGDMASGQARGQTSWQPSSA